MVLSLRLYLAVAIAPDLLLVLRQGTGVPFTLPSSCHASGQYLMMLHVEASVQREKMGRENAYFLVYSFETASQWASPPTVTTDSHVLRWQAFATKAEFN